MKKIIHFVHIAAGPDRVFDALTTETGVTGWWSTNATVTTGVGGMIKFYFTKEFRPNMEVTDLEQDRLVLWKCVSGHDYWKDNEFRFELRAEGGATKLLFTQIYAQELSDEIYGTYNFNWGYYLNSLKKYCEAGVGAPFAAQAASGYGHKSADN